MEVRLLSLIVFPASDTFRGAGTAACRGRAARCPFIRSGRLQQLYSRNRGRLFGGQLRQEMGAGVSAPESDSPLWLRGICIIMSAE